MSRTLKRPEQGWAHKPNSRLGDWLFLVFLMFCSAQFFAWASAALDALLTGIGSIS